MRRICVRWLGFLMLALIFSGTIHISAQTQGKAKSQVPGKTQTLKGKTINVNKATATDWVKNVPLITPELAKRIVKYREDNGDFQTLEELLQIEGFNRDLLRRIKPFLLLEGIGGTDCTC